MKHLILLSILFILLSCSIDSSNDLPDPHPANAKIIKSVNFDEDSVNFTVVSSVPQPCYSFASSKIESSNEVVNITIYTQRKTNDPCPDMVSSIESDITVPVESGNTYLFKFWKYNETTLDTTIIIP